jgi:hypothetical protein
MGECVAEGDDDPWEGVPKRLESWEFVDGTIVPPLAGASDAARAFGAGWDAFPKFPKFPKCLCNTLGINGLRVGTQFQPCIGDAGEETARGGVAFRYGSVRPEDVERGGEMMTSGRPSQSDWEVWEFWELSQNGWEFVAK